MSQHRDAQLERIRRIDAIENTESTRQIAGRFGVAEALRRTLRCLSQITQRVRKIPALLEMQGEHRRNLRGEIAIGLFQPLAQAPVNLHALSRRQMLINDVLIQDMPESI